MQKAHNNINWVNFPSVDTPLSQTNLNAMDRSIDTIDDRVVAFDTTKANQSDFLLAIRTISYEQSTGIFTITLFNGTSTTIDTDIEKIPVNFTYDDDPTSAHYQQLILTLDDGTVKYIDLSALITQYEFDNSNTIAFTNTSGRISANIVDGSVTDQKIQPNYLADITAQAQAGASAAQSALDSKYDSEAWANGTRDGIPVNPSDPTYRNNSKYWSQQANVTTFAALTDVELTNLQDGQVIIYDAYIDKFINTTLPASGTKAHLIVISDTGSVVTATKGTTVIYATETTTGHFECDLSTTDPQDVYGTWIIDAVLSGDDAQVSLVVDAIKVYTVDDSHFHADITVTYPSGGTCSCSQSGQTTLYATGSPYTFTVHHSGTWTITTTANGKSYAKSVVITTSGQTESLLIPVGSQITPTDDVPSLIACAGIGDSTITTISELLADSTILSAVINSNNAIDYLVRSITFVTDVTTDSTAMNYIGLDNYASNILLADSTWLSAIVNSTYRESILNVKCPIMTSNTTPSGEAIASAEDTANGYYAYKPLDGTLGLANRWQATFVVGAYIGYGFTSAKCIKGVYLLTRQDNATIKSYAIKSFRLEGSDDKSTWTDISGGKTVDVDQQHSYFAINNNTSYKYYRINIRSNNGGASVVCKTYQLYGREDV